MVRAANFPRSIARDGKMMVECGCISGYVGEQLVGSVRCFAPGALLYSFAASISGGISLLYIDQLPECMKVCYREVLDVYDEMEELMRHELGTPTSDGRSSSCHIQYAKEGMKQFDGAYLVEAKWLHKGCTPKMEYMQNATISAGCCKLDGPLTKLMNDHIVKHDSHIEL
ncbi:hypothetical protein Scep_013133 [Stephania cephalantha]|uniref:Terpene synthase metal-binding domain-containing protein n=1 Tax=Stephania cephalantha TaxID=152367 RepID=A0AAP0JII6_9MAGN